MYLHGKKITVKGVEILSSLDISRPRVEPGRFDNRSGASAGKGPATLWTLSCVLSDYHNMFVGYKRKNEFIIR